MLLVLLLLIAIAFGIDASRWTDLSTLARNRRAWIGMSAVFVLLLLWVSCGGGSGGNGGGPVQQPLGTPAGTYTLTITGTSGKITHSTTLTLTVQ